MLAAPIERMMQLDREGTAYTVSVYKANAYFARCPVIATDNAKDWLLVKHPQLGAVHINLAVVDSVIIHEEGD